MGHAFGDGLNRIPVSTKKMFRSVLCGTGSLTLSFLHVDHSAPLFTACVNENLSAIGVPNMPHIWRGWIDLT